MVEFLRYGLLLFMVHRAWDIERVMKSLGVSESWRHRYFNNVIFPIGCKVREIEMNGFTQRKERRKLVAFWRTLLG